MPRWEHLRSTTGKAKLGGAVIGKLRIVDCPMHVQVCPSKSQEMGIKSIVRYFPFCADASCLCHATSTVEPSVVPLKPCRRSDPALITRRCQDMSFHNGRRDIECPPSVSQDQMGSLASSGVVSSLSSALSRVAISSRINVRI